MKKSFWIAATIVALAGASTLSYGAELPKGATAIRAGMTSLPLNSHDQALVKNGHLVPTYNFMTMAQCQAVAFCTCFMTGGDEGTTCYTLAAPASASALKAR